MRLFRFGLIVTLAVAAVACMDRRISNPQEPVLYANLWMQTSAEYYAICEQTFAMAYERIATLAESGPQDRPLAIVMDLDETVIDNSGFQTYLFHTATSYSEEAWEDYVQYQSEAPDPEAVPGAVEFVSKVEQLSVTVVYISNRSESSRRQTLRTLSRLGVDTSEDQERFLLRTTTSSKTERRNLASQKYRIIAWLGDNLADFASEYEDGASGSPDVRRKNAERARTRWGADWFVLPNPTYGDYLGVLDPPLPNHLAGPSALSP